MFTILKTFVDDVLSAGGTDEDIARIGTNNVLRGELVAVVMRYANKATVVVQRTFADMLAACKQKWWNPDFTESRFPLEPVTVDENEWEMGEHFFSEKGSNGHFGGAVIILDRSKFLQSFGTVFVGLVRGAH